MQPENLQPENLHDSNGARLLYLYGRFDVREEGTGRYSVWENLRGGGVAERRGVVHYSNDPALALHRACARARDLWAND